jgi:hypothetical protein
MHILLITKNFYANTNIGPVVSIKNYLKYSLKKNNIIILDHNSLKKKGFKKKNFEIIFIKNIIDLFTKLAKINNIFKKIDYVEFHSLFDFYILFPIIFLSYLKKKKIKIYLRGMVNDNVFINKRFVKNIYLYFLKLFLKDSLIVCTSKYELNISSKYFNKNHIIIENNKVSKKYIDIKFKKLVKKSGNLKILFYSNISWKKNFPFVYEILKDLDFRVELNIYGQLFIKENYFNQMLTELNSKHLVNYNGYNQDEDKRKIFNHNHLLFFPTLDENFGHVIVENFLHYRPCLLSNNTPWNDNEYYDAGYSISLDKKYKFKKVLKYFFLMNQNKFDKHCFASKKYILDKLKYSDY